MIGNTGVSSSWKPPGFVGKVNFGAGAVSASSGRLACLLIGMKTSAGSIVVDVSPIRVTSEDEVDAACGVGSQLARMAYKALLIPSVELWLAAVTEPGAGTAATLTMVIAGTVGNGLLRFRIAGTAITVSVSSTMAIDDVGAAIVAAVNAKTKLPCTAAYNAGTDTLTLTLKNKGASGLLWNFYWDKTDAPSALTLTITGSATLNTEGYKFGAGGTGSGAEDITTLLTKLTQRRWARIATGFNDATNLALLETHVNTKAGPLSLLLDQFVVGQNAAAATASSIAQTTLNAHRAQVIWHRNSESHPCEIAAVYAAMRSVQEQSNPVYDWDTYGILPGIAPQAFDADIATLAEQDVALNAGVTPVVTVNGEAKIVRSITTYCLNSGSTQDERCLDIGDAAFPDYAVLDLKLLYDTEVRPQNPYIGPNPASGEEPPPAGVAYPDLWKNSCSARMAEWYANNWTEKLPTGVWAPVVGYNVAGKYITCDIPLPVRRLWHRVDTVVNQTAIIA